MASTDRVLVPLPDGRWLALPPDVFRQALEAGAQAMSSPAGAATGAAQPTEPEPFLNAGELAQALNLPKSCVYERARSGHFPSHKVRKHLRFLRSEVLAAIRAAAPQAEGHS
jgi:excisionase family DNA binding protein